MTIVGLLSLPRPVLAQPGGIWGVLNERFTLTQSLRDKNISNEPAIALVTIPDKGRTESLVAAAARLTIDTDGSVPKFRLGAAFQFNYNSAVDSRQRALFAGGQVELRTGCKDPAIGFKFARIKATTGYKRNSEAHTSSIASDAYLTVEENRPETDSTSAVLIGDHFELAPQTGLEVERVLSGSAADKGQRVRAMVAAQANFSPLPVRASRIILSANVAYRRDVATDFPSSDRDHPFAQVGVSVRLDPNNVFSVSGERLVGDDPTQGFLSSGQWRIGLKVRYAPEEKKRIERARRLRQVSPTALPPKNRIL